MMTAPHRTNDWFREDIFRLIELYRDRPCLWNQDHPDRRNKICKDQSWTEIVDMLQVERTEIERKIKSLYTQFFREYKKKLKIESLPGCENVFKSKWFAFEELLFLSKRLKERSVNQYVTEDDDSFADIMRMSQFNNNNNSHNNTFEQQQHLQDQLFQDQLIMQHEHIMQQQQQDDSYLNDLNNNNNPNLKRKCSEMFEDNDYDDPNNNIKNNNRDINLGNNNNSCHSGMSVDNGVVIIDCKDDNGSDHCDANNIQNGCLNDLDNTHHYVNNRSCHDADTHHVTKMEISRIKRKEKAMIKKVAKRYNKKSTSNNNSAFENKTFTSNSLHTNTHTNTHTTSVHNTHTSTYNSKDEYSVYGELVACKLRKLPSMMVRSQLQRQISEILYRAEMKSYPGNAPPDFKGGSDGAGFTGGGESVGVGSDNGVDDGSSLADESNVNGDVGCGGVDEKNEVHQINGDVGCNEDDDGGGGVVDYVVGGGKGCDVFIDDAVCNGTDNDLDLTCSPINPNDHHINNNNDMNDNNANDNDRDNDDKMRDNNDKRGDNNGEFDVSPYTLLSEPYHKPCKQELN